MWKPKWMNFENDLISQAEQQQRKFNSQSEQGMNISFGSLFNVYRG